LTFAIVFEPCAAGRTPSVRIAVIVGLLSAFLVGVPVGHARDKVFRAQLDRDAPREQLRTEVRRCGQPFACSRLVVRDGSRRQALRRFVRRHCPTGGASGARD
jgi:hypothetical protein